MQNGRKNKKKEKERLKPVLEISEMENLFKDEAKNTEFIKDLPLIRKIIKKNHKVLDELGEE